LGSQSAPGNAQDNILYHALVIPLKPWELRDQSEDSFPVTELITAKQDVLAISSWLMQYQTWPLFDRIVTAYSMANIIAVNQASNDLSVPKYLDLIYAAVTENLNLEDIVKINLCSSHLTKNMTDDVTTFFGPKSDNPLSENALTELKCLLGFMYTIRKYEDLKEFWGCCCVLLKNPYICTETNEVRNKISEFYAASYYDTKDAVTSDSNLPQKNTTEEIIEEVKSNAMYANSKFFIDFN
jgi:hypothetical protein